jgi:beta-N-acetylhexosaminidase
MTRRQRRQKKSPIILLITLALILGLAAITILIPCITLLKVRSTYDGLARRYQQYTNALALWQETPPPYQPIASSWSINTYEDQIESMNDNLPLAARAYDEAQKKHIAYIAVITKDCTDLIALASMYGVSVTASCDQSLPTTNDMPDYRAQESALEQSIAAMQLPIAAFEQTWLSTTLNVEATPLSQPQMEPLMPPTQNLSLEDKLGQLLFINIPGTTLSEDTIALLEQIKPGGVMLMTGNIRDRDQVRQLTQQLQEHSTIPLLIAIDQEGGSVKRIPWDPTPSAYDLRIASEDEVCRAGWQRALVLKDVGINLNFAPVLDLSASAANYIDRRSLGSDPSQVATRGATYIRCQQLAGVGATAKHFPGHNTSANSHTTLPVIRTTQADWFARDALPFQQAIDHDVFAVMVGHLVYSEFDPDLPASLSQSDIAVLKDRWQYEGLIITDDLNMLRQTTDFTDIELITKTFAAGNYLLLNIQSTLEEQVAFKTTLQTLIANGTLNQSELADRIQQIVQAKEENIDTSGIYSLTSEATL